MYESIETIRRIFFGVFVLLVTAFIAIVFMMKIEERIGKPEKVILVKDACVRVYRKNGLKWEIWASRIEIEDSEKHRIEDIHRGTFYRENDPPMFFTAKGGFYDSAAEKVALEGDMVMESPNGDFFRSDRLDWDGRKERISIPVPVVFSLDGNTYNGSEMEAWGEDIKGYRIRGDVRADIPDLKKSGSDELVQELEEEEVEDKYTKGLTLTARLVEYDRDEKVMKCFSKEDEGGIFVPGMLPGVGEDDRVKLVGEKYTIESQEMFLDEGRKFARVVGRVWILKEAEETREDDKKPKRVMLKRDTTFETDEAYYYWKKGHVDAPGEVWMKRPGTTAHAGRAFADSKKDTATLSGGVTIFQEKGEWLIEDGAIEETAGDEKKDAAREATTVNCLNLEMDMDKDNLYAYGDVVVVQEKRRILCRAAYYDGDAETWTLSGNPYLEEEDYELAAERMVYREGEGLFEAMGAGEAEIRLDDDQKDDVAEYFRDRDGDDFDRKTLERDNVVVKGRYLKYNEEADTLDAEGDALMMYRDVTVAADSIRIDYSSETADGEGNVKFDDPRNRATAERFSLSWKEKNVEMGGAVKLRDAGRPAKGDREESEAFDLEAGQVVFNWKTRAGAAEGAVKTSAAGRYATAKKLEFDREKKRYRFTGEVSIHQESGEWIDKYGIFDEEDDAKARKLAKKPTDVWCDEAVFDGTDETVELSGGNVLIRQQHRELRARRVTVDDRKKEFRAEGNVYLSQDSGDWIFEEEMVDEELEEDVEERLRRALRVTAELLVSIYSEDRVYLEGGVHVVEGASSVIADRVWHYGESKRTVFEGGVRFRDEKSREFAAGRVVYDGESKTVEAFNSVEGSAFRADFEEKK